MGVKKSDHSEKIFPLQTPDFPFGAFQAIALAQGSGLFAKKFVVCYYRRQSCSCVMVLQAPRVAARLGAARCLSYDDDPDCFKMCAKSINKVDANGVHPPKDSGKSPAYARLASSIKQMIASGQYQPDSKIPSEAAISRSYGLSPMTVRQAVGLLVEQGLLRRVHGSGTYVCGPDWTKASFGLEGLLEILHEKNEVSIKILKAAIARAKSKAAAALGVEVGCPIVALKRLVSYQGKPLLLNNASLRFDPRSPIVESELEVSSLSGLFTGQGNSFIKKASLMLEPSLLSPSEAAYLQSESESAAFKINYIFYGYSDVPVGSGWFLAPRSTISLTTRIGVWDD